MAIKTAAVIGSGVMGSGIAAQIANAGVPVLLLDIVPPGAEDRSALAKRALKKLAKAEPAAFMSKSAAKLVTPGNLEDDLDRLAEIDWIVEAVVENLDIKRALYAKLEDARKPGSVVSSNTSTLPLAKLVDGLPERFRRDFLITHFFNPPRYMRLLEVVKGDQTDPEVVARITAFADNGLGKSVIDCKDTPGFVANRIGCYWIQSALKHAFESGLPVEEADAVMGRPLGIPKTGVFGLADLVGIDLLPHVATSLRSTLAPDDAFHGVDRDWPLIQQMIETGYTGRKGKGGFYRLNTTGGGRVKEAIDLTTGDYHTAAKPRLEALNAAKTGGARALFEADEPAARYAWQVMAGTLSYAASLVPEVADDIVAIDRAMRLGYNLKWGPFELLDRIGPAWFRGRLEAEGIDVPSPVAQGGRRDVLSGGRRGAPAPDAGRRLRRRGAARRRAPARRCQTEQRTGGGQRIGQSLGHRRRCAVPRVPQQDERDRPRHPGDRREGRHPRAQGAQGAGDLQRGQQFLGRRQYRRRPVRGQRRALADARGYRRQGPEGLSQAEARAVSGGRRALGHGLGGGCEICLNADAIQAHAETYAGLVEVGVGLIPAWTGTTELLTRWVQRSDRPGGPMPPIAQTFETIGLAKVAKSAAEARDLMILRKGDGITMNRDRLLADAKAKALAMAEDYARPKSPKCRFLARPPRLP